MTGVSDFTAEFNIVSDDGPDPVDEPQGPAGESADSVHAPQDSADESQNVADESQGSGQKGHETGGHGTGHEADDLSMESDDSGTERDSAGPTSGESDVPSATSGMKSIPVIREDQIEDSANSNKPTAATPPPSVPGIEHGDDDLPATSVMETVPWDEDASSDETDSSATSDQLDEKARGDFFEGLQEDPRTAALQILDEGDENETVYETRSAAERLEEILLDGKRVLDRREAAKLGGISTVSARKMWRALGMSQTDGAEKAYTVSDAHALRMWAKPVADGLIDQSTALSLARAIGQTTDRLVVWQMETLVDFLTEEEGLTDPEARRDALQLVEDMVDPLQRMLTYSWRRNLAEVMGRLNVNVSDGLAIDNRQGWYDSSMPLARAVGFIDLVSYTRLSQKMEPRQLANLVQEFQGMAYNIVATGGGRVIKTVGDEVFFAAETPLGGAEIAMTLMERVTAAEDLPQARVGFVWGRVLSRLGDIFGSSVNLAARLTAVADPGTIFTDEDTARVLSASDAYVFERRESLSLQGLGETGIGEMKRGTAARMQLDLDDDEN
ncbi:adenylate/guanylate cyclase domain-containing protein [Brevibacterium zhoupengii]|uniref:adenylate/guanylate cyclase domain-containing protein n=1 Tax=Brevibacterium zhoupengii TaxID=2898795 RepID=UPI001E4128D7|nr:adenylate/guanylate cyclase domain-containing protein [Brevibacterium zhoupengii]